MKASITRDGRSVALSITIDIPFLDARVFVFDWDCQSEVYAGLLANAIKNQTTRTLKRIRCDAYEEGWRDAKARRKKETMFSGCW